VKLLSTDLDPPSPAASKRPGGLIAAARARLGGPFARRFVALSGLTAAGQLSFLAALPVLSRQYTPADFGVFAVYLAIVNLAGPLMSLKFDSALYAARSREEAAQTLVLALLSVCVMTALSFAGIWIARDALAGRIGAADNVVVYLLPLGMLLSGGWSISSAWTVRCEASATLGVARFVQPFLMTVIQLAAGAVEPSGTTLLVAHLCSHVVYTSFIALREIGRADLVAMRATTLSQILALATRNRKFPMFALPAQLSSLSVSNLPPMLLSFFYGASIAGHYGVAYRLVVAPLTIASMPLGAIFIGNLVRARTQMERGPLVRKVFLLNLAMVGAPVVILGVLATPMAPLALGANWALTGQIVTALSFLGAAQALAAPFSEATSVFEAQGLRLFIESVTAIFVVAALILCGMRGIDARQAIWAMSIGGAILSLTGTALVVGRIDGPAPRGEDR
jgi:O-antigen/teichoic acid export membrane protein